MCTNINRDDYVVCNMIIEVTDVDKAELVDLVQSLHRFWDVEAIGSNEASPGEIVDSFPMSITFDWNQVSYCIRLPWKSDVRPQTDAFHLCVGRLYQLRNRLKKDESLLQEHNAVFQKQLPDGIIERVPAHEEKSKPRYFIPHHGLVRSDKETTKLHVVFDGSEKANQGDFSLNECLKKSPNMTPHIFDTLLRFRSHQVGIIADIQKAFHQIAIDERGREFLRFLWFDNITINVPAVTQYRFTRLVFGLTPSPAILNRVIQAHLTRYLLTKLTLSKQLAGEFYVDDFTGGAETVEEAFTTYGKAKELMRKGGFNLRKWYTNSADLQQKIDHLENAGLLESTDTLVKILIGIPRKTSSLLSLSFHACSHCVLQSSARNNSWSLAIF